MTTSVTSSNLNIETGQDRRRSFLRYINRGLLIIFPLSIFLTVVYPTTAFTTGVLAVVSLPTYFIVRYLYQHNRTTLAGLLFNGLLEGTFIFLLWQGVRAPVQDVMNNTLIMMMLGLPIIFAGATIGRRAAVAVAALNLIVQLILIFFYGASSLPTFSINVYWWALALSVWLYETILLQALQRLYAIQAQLETLVETRTQSLQQTVAELEKSKSQLEEANKALDSFSYSVSHDLRAPLRSIDGFSYILAEDYETQLDEDGQGHLKRIREGAQRMGELIDDLLDFSRFGRQALVKQSVDTGQLVAQVLEELKPDYEARAVELKLGDLPACEADPVLLRQVWANLLANALKYSRTRTPAQIEVGWLAEPKAYFVRDNGAGFDMRYADKLFEVFQRLHNTREFEGTGVGLAMVKRIVERHGGRIWAEAEVDKGAVFYFSLP
jgi:signal transduction histidine kinase